MQWMPTLLDAYFESFHHTNGITSGRIRSINGRCRFTVEEGGRDQPADPRTFEIRSKVVAFPLGGGDKDELLRLRHDVTELGLLLNFYMASLVGRFSAFRLYATLWPLRSNVVSEGHLKLILTLRHEVKR